MLSTGLGRLEADVNAAYGAGVVKPASLCWYREVGGTRYGCALMAAYLLHNPGLEPYVSMDTLMRWAAYHYALPRSACGPLGGVVDGFDFPGDRAEFTEPNYLAGHEAGSRLNERWKPNSKSVSVE